MNEPIWLNVEIILAIQTELLARFEEEVVLQTLALASGEIEADAYAAWRRDPLWVSESV